MQSCWLDYHGQELSKTENGKFRNQEESDAFIALLRHCARNKDLHKGVTVHAQVLQKGFLGNKPYIASTLVNMYAKCGAFVKAKEVLDGVPIRDVVFWSTLIAGYVQAGHAKEALNCFEYMQHEGVSGNVVTFACIFRACGSLGLLEKGEKIHLDIVREGLLHGHVLGGTLVDMYAKCGAYSKAREVLEGLAVQDAISWSALISGYIQGGHAKEALDCFEQMQCEGYLPDAITFACILKACATVGALQKGEHMHSSIATQGLLCGDILLGNALVDMYAKCGELAKAKVLLKGLPSQDVVSWNALIAGFVEGGHCKAALNCFEEMQHEGYTPDVITFISTLRACGGIGAVDMGKNIHAQILQHGLLARNVELGGALVDMYAKCDALVTAKEVLEVLPVRNVVSWSALIEGYAEGGDGKEALDCFEGMQCEGICPGSFTYACILRVCGKLGAVEKGKEIHFEVVRRGLLWDVVLGGALVDMYAKCGVIAKAKEVFERLPVRDVVSWSALIAGYVQTGHCHEALDSFELMQYEGLSPDAVTYICILRACGGLGALEVGESLHLEIVSRQLLCKNIILGNVLVDMYAKCGAFTNAKEVLEGLPVQDVVSWNAMIAGYVQREHAKEALDCFEEMLLQELSPNAVTFVCILSVCGSIGAVGKGENILNAVLRQGMLDENIVLGNALVDMYAKCGAFLKSKEVLERLSVRNVVSWSALIAGYNQGEHVKETLNCFEQMQCEGLVPDEITFLSILTVCSHLSLVHEGYWFFMMMSRCYDIIPGSKHYTCMVNLFGCLGLLDEAVAVVKKMPSCDCIPAWSALLFACQKCGNLQLGRWAFEHAPHLDLKPFASFCLYECNLLGS